MGRISREWAWKGAGVGLGLSLIFDWEILKDRIMDFAELPAEERRSIVDAPVADETVANWRLMNFFAAKFLFTILGYGIGKWLGEKREDTYPL